MLRCATMAVLAVLASVPFAPAADKAEKAKKPVGAWTRTVNDFTITFTFEEDTLVVELNKSSGEAVTVQASYGATADGLIFGVINKVEKKGNDGPEKGDLFSFQYKLEKDTMTLSDLNSKGGSDAAQVLQGEYKQKTIKDK
jgi:hypothetical protein